MESEYFFNVGIDSAPAFEYLEHTASSSVLSCPPLHPAVELQSLWEKSADHSRQFDSGLSSLASSPAASNSTKTKENFVIRELIGKLGNIEDEILLHSQPYMAPSFIPAGGNPHKFVELSSNLTELSADPGFAERAARLSCFGNRSFNGRPNPNQLAVNSMEIAYTPAKGRLSRVPVAPPCRSWDHEAESTVSEQVRTMVDAASKKRKAPSKPKPKAPPREETSNDDNSETEKFTIKEEDESKESTGDEKRSKTTPKSEPPKDYIHVRARRGQATDSHSLAERVRREKISERMKLLQDLVPGCNKVTGKASMLDEIINYVQSLQRQVEFLSMKLASVNTRVDLNMDSLLNKEILQVNQLLSHPSLPLDAMASSLFGHQSLFSGSEPMETSLCQNFQLPEFPQNGYSLCEGDLQSVVHMSFNPNQTPTQNGSHHMKVEL